MKRFLAIGLLICAWLALCGMGFLPEGKAQVPKTKENYAATVYDAAGVSTKLTHFSIDKETYLSARMGGGSVSIPFDRIEEISFSDHKATVNVKGEKPAVVNVESDLTAYGLSEYGPFRIKLKELRRVVIQGLAETKKSSAKP